MNLFIHGRLHHFMAETDGDGNDLPGGDTETEEEEEEEDPDDEGAEASEVTITIDGEEPVEEEDLTAAPNWVRDLRKTNREDKRRIRELEEQVRKQSAPAAANVPVLGKKPAMEDDDVDWDAEKFEQKLTEWHDRKRQIEQAETEQQTAQKKQQEEWNGRLENYASKKTGLKVRDFEDAEDAVKGLFDVTQQGIIIQGADDPAAIVYALGKNPKKLAELAGIKDAVKFSFAIAKLETRLKIGSKKPAAPPPEKTVSGQGRITGAVDSTLEKLREEAAKTGDSSKVIAYKRDQKRKARG